MLLKTVKKYMKDPVKIFGSIKNSCEVIDKLKSRGFRAASLSTCDFFYIIYYLPGVVGWCEGAG